MSFLVSPLPWPEINFLRRDPARRNFMASCNDQQYHIAKIHGSRLLFDLCNHTFWEPGKVAALADKPELVEPAAVIGPEFARHLGNGGEIFTVTTGSRMFIMTVANVREYLVAVCSDAAEN